MRILIDTVCSGCGHRFYDVFVDRVNRIYDACSRCGAATSRLWDFGSTAQVHQDSIEGGVLIEHGLCHPGGEPRRYYSKSEMVREAKRRGLVNVVEHKTDRGTDKSPNTQRWV